MASTTTAHAPEDDNKWKRTRLPHIQLSIVYLIATAEPISSTVIYPFINQFVRETGITRGDERKTGYYAGVIESVFYVAECATTIAWGRASDRWGRRPILLAGTLGLALSMFSFGLSSSFWVLLVSRCAQGTFNGNIGVVKNVLVEITDTTNRARAFSFYSPVWAGGTTLGPLIGGAFARPALRWPETFGRLQFFHDYPYFLPCAIAGFFSVFSFIVCLVLLRETLPSIIARRRIGGKLKPASPSRDTTSLRANTNGADYGATNHGIETDDETPLCQETADSPRNSASPPVLSVLTRPVCMAIANIGMLAFTDSSYQALVPLMYSTSIPLGGLGFNPARIGGILGAWGLLNGVINVMMFPFLMRKYGAWAVYRVGYSSFLISIGSFPLMSLLAKRSGEFDWPTVAAMVLQLTGSTMSYFSWASIQMFVIDSMPNPHSMATVNAIAQVTTSLARTFGPSFASSLFSLSLEHKLLGGYLVYAILISVILCGMRLAERLPRHLSNKM
ncbi:hypothetical protein HGRIS_000894 [Hohenbuehelia grisea]|uniref:Major facilitator superfamily (MFS) profile domain-containing protein n=1 Tax=Hohenbuehelia grisea TaxID=104357 RepID=A0ABR3IQ32_9AGAR